LYVDYTGAMKNKYVKPIIDQQLISKWQAAKAEATDAQLTVEELAEITVIITNANDANDKEFELRNDESAATVEPAEEAEAIIDDSSRGTYETQGGNNGVQRVKYSNGKTYLQFNGHEVLDPASFKKDWGYWGLIEDGGFCCNKISHNGKLTVDMDLTYNHSYSASAILYFWAPGIGNWPKPITMTKADAASDPWTIYKTHLPVNSKEHSGDKFPWVVIYYDNPVKDSDKNLKYAFVPRTMMTDDWWNQLVEFYKKVPRLNSTALKSWGRMTLWSWYDHSRGGPSVSYTSDYNQSGANSWGPKLSKTPQWKQQGVEYFGINTAGEGVEDTRLGKGVDAEIGKGDPWDYKAAEAAKGRP